MRSEGLTKREIPYDSSCECAGRQEKHSGKRCTRGQNGLREIIRKRIRRGFCGDLDHSADLFDPDVQYQFQNGISGVVDHIDHCDRALSDLRGISP